MRGLIIVVALAACGGDSSNMSPPDAPGDGGGSGSADCPRALGPDDGVRHVVVSHPYDDAGNGAPTFEVLDLSGSGMLTRAQPPRTFTLAKRASFGTVEFTPDGEVGVVALEDGTVGAFRLAADGSVTVTEMGKKGAGYVERLVMSPAGDRLWALDPDTVGNHGGVYEFGIGCDGTLVDHGLVVAADVPRAMVRDGDHAIIAARSVFDQPVGANDLQLIAWTSPPSALASADAFPGADSDGHDEAIVGGAALTADGATVLVGDTSGFSGIPNRVAVVTVGPSTLTPVTVLSPLEDPESIVTSPFGNVAVVSSAFGDALFVIDKPAATWRIRGQVAYAGGVKPQLPGDMVELRRGMLRGHVLVAENTAIRHLVFRDTGTVDDLGTLPFGSGLAQIVGAIGVTP